MANPRRLWTDYPPQFAALAKSAATAPLPILYGPLPKWAANTFRSGFYHFRDALRASLTARDGSYPARLYEAIEILSVKIEPSADDQSLYNIIFDKHPIVAVMDKLDPATAQVQQLARSNFAAAQRAPNISKPIFTDEEMQQRLDEIDEEG